MPEFNLISFNPDLIKPRAQYCSKIHEHHDYKHNINQATDGIRGAIDDIKMLTENFAGGVGKSSDYHHRHKNHHHSMHEMYGGIKRDVDELRAENQFLSKKVDKLVGII